MSWMQKMIAKWKGTVLAKFFAAPTDLTGASWSKADVDAAGDETPLPLLPPVQTEPPPKDGRPMREQIEEGFFFQEKPLPHSLTQSLPNEFFLCAEEGLPAWIDDFWQRRGLADEPHAPLKLDLLGAVLAARQGDKTEPGQYVRACLRRGVRWVWRERAQRLIADAARRIEATRYLTETDAARREQAESLSDEQKADNARKWGLR